MKIFVKILLLCFSLQVRCSEKKYTVLDTAEYILPCQKSDPDIDECVIRGINHLRPYLIEGIKEVEMPSIEPLATDKLVIDNGQGVFKIKATFYNVLACGISEYSIKSLKGDFSTYTIDASIGIPKLQIQGNYDVKGHILRIPVESRGTFTTTFYDFDVVVKLCAKVVTNEKGIRFLQISDLIMDFTLKNSEFDIQDEQMQKTALGTSLVQLLRDYSEEILEETKSTTASVLANHFKSVLNPVLLHIPLTLFLPDA